MIDSKPSSPEIPSYSALGDGDLPSYDTATAFTSGPSQAGGSSSSALSAAPPLSAQQKYLFSGPPGAESISSPATYPLGRFSIRFLEAEKKVVTLDPRAENPEALYDFLKGFAQEVPKLRLRCVGYHSETPDRDGTAVVNGQLQQRKKGEVIRVTDFDFFIDMTDIITPAGTALAVLPSWIPAYRGQMSTSYGATHLPAQRNSGGYSALMSGSDFEPTAPGRTLTWSQQHSQNQRYNKQWGAGFPVWAKATDMPLKGIRLPGDESDDVERSAESDNDSVQPSLRAWCDAYCADRGWLKEFVIRRKVWGWDFDGVTKAVKAAIASSGYASPDLTIALQWEEETLSIKPTNIWTTLNNKTFVHVLLCITLIYPIVTLLHFLGLLPGTGGKYNLARATYNLKPFPPLPSTYLGESIQAAKDRLPGLMKLNPQLPRQPVLRPGPKGVHYLAGRREGEWFGEWEERIRIAAQMRFFGELTGRVEPSRDVSLDGYDRGRVPDQ